MVLFNVLPGFSPICSRGIPHAHKRKPILSLVCCCPDGLPFGYDAIVIFGAVGFLGEHFLQNAALPGWKVSGVLQMIDVLDNFGMTVVVICYVDKLGRKSRMPYGAMDISFYWRVSGF